MPEQECGGSFAAHTFVNFLYGYQNHERYILLLRDILSDNCQNQAQNNTVVL
jgi:hypothetical protein